MSTRYNTGNPIGSTDVRDMSDNAKNLDLFSNSSDMAFDDRFGVERKTIHGMNSEFNSHILNMGFARIGTFASGATLTNPRQTLLWDIADGGDGQEYGWSGTFAPHGKIVPPSSSPTSTGGIAIGAWVSRFDPLAKTQIRESLRRSYAEAGYALVSGSFEIGGTLTSATDVLLYEVEGKAYSWGGALPKTVSAGSSPASTGGVGASAWIDKSQNTGTILTPEMFGAVGNGVADDTVGLNLWANAVRASGFPGRCRNATYRVNEANGGVIIDGHRGTVIDFCGAVFKALDGQPVVANNGGISFSNNQDCHFLNGTYDGNRANRTPGPEVLNHSIGIWGNNARIKFTKFRAINGVVDGWYLRGTPSSLASYPTDITLEDCEGLNNFRNNMSSVGSVRLKIIRGRYNDAVGIPPQAGIDVEPNIEDIHGNVDINIIDVETTGNGGYGTSLGGFFPASGTIRGLRSYGNKGCALKLIAVDDIEVIDTKAGDMSVLDRGVIDVGAEAKNVRIKGVHVKGITAASDSDRSAVYTHASAENVSVKDVSAENCSVPTLVSYSPSAILKDIDTQDCTATKPAVSIGTQGVDSIIDGVSSRRTAGVAFECAAPNCDISDLYLEDSASTTASARIWSAGNTVRGVRVHQTSGIVPAGTSALRIDAVQAELSSVTATGGYTDANTIFGTANKFVGTKLSNISPDPFAKSFSFDPPSLASGGSYTTTTPLSKANLGDACVVSAPYDLQGIIVTASVSAIGAVRVSLYNPTAGTIDLASGTWSVSLKKS